MMKILIVDDSALIRNILKSLFADAGDFEVIGEATNGQQGLSLVKTLQPDLVLMDINMPVMDGLEATRRIIAEHPVPICIFSNEVDSDLTVKALGSGALDAIRKPDIDKMNEPDFLARFLERLRGLSKAHPRRIRDTGRPPEAQGYQAVVVGASTGGPLALKELLGRIPPDFPLGIALVQHIEDRFDRSFAEWLNTQTALGVRLAKGGEKFIPGTVWVAPAGTHLIVREGVLDLDDGPKVVNQKPAVDRLFETAARWFGKSLVSVLLTGMGTDGASGSLKVKENGGHTIVQDEESSAIFGMPRAAIERGAAVKVLPLLEISAYLTQLGGKK
jgi:two-component system, chemotaxis family, protein-glutamate methylesterase/glutaminase